MSEAKRLAAENRCFKRNLHCCIEIRSFSFKSGLTLHSNLKEHISCLSAVLTGHSFSTQTDLLSGIDSCGNVYFQ